LISVFLCRSTIPDSCTAALDPSTYKVPWDILLVGIFHEEESGITLAGGLMVEEQQP